MCHATGCKQVSGWMLNREAVAADCEVLFLPSLTYTVSCSRTTPHTAWRDMWVQSFDHTVFLQRLQRQEISRKHPIRVCDFISQSEWREEKKKKRMYGKTQWSLLVPVHAANMHRTNRKTVTVCGYRQWYTFSIWDTRCEYDSIILPFFCNDFKSSLLWLVSVHVVSVAISRSVLSDFSLQCMSTDYCAKGKTGCQQNVMQWFASSEEWNQPMI